MEPTTSSFDVRELNERIHQQSAFIDLLMMELNKTLVGQKHMIERLLIGMLANGHVLLEGKPTVFVYAQGAYEAREVEPGERVGGRTVLKSGLTAGDQVVTSGAYALKARKLKSQLGHGH